MDTNFPNPRTVQIPRVPINAKSVKDLVWYLGLLQESIQGMYVKGFDNLSITMSNFGISKARAYLNADQDNLINGAATKILLDAESYDISGEFASNKFTVATTGYYLIVGQVAYNAVVINKLYQAMIYVDGAGIASAYGNSSAATTDLMVNVITIAYLTATQYIELYGLSGAGADTVDVSGGAALTYLCVHRLS